MKKYTLLVVLTIFFLVLGILSIPLIDDNYVVLFFTALLFLGSICCHDAMMEEWTIIKDNASMDRPE